MNYPNSLDIERFVTFSHPYASCQSFWHAFIVTRIYALAPGVQKFLPLTTNSKNYLIERFLVSFIRFLFAHEEV